MAPRQIILGLPKVRHSLTYGHFLNALYLEVEVRQLCKHLTHLAGRLSFMGLNTPGLYYPHQVVAFVQRLGHRLPSVVVGELKPLLPVILGCVQSEISAVFVEHNRSIAKLAHDLVTVRHVLEAVEGLPVRVRVVTLDV